MKRLLVFIGIIGLGLAFLPALAISENDDLTVCDEYQQLQASEYDAIFTAFQGQQSFNVAAALLRNRDSSGALPDHVAQRFAAAQSKIQSTPESYARRTRMQEIERLGGLKSCAG